MNGYSFSICKDVTSFTFINNTKEKRDMLSRKWSHYSILYRLINFMEDRGFNIEHDKEVDKLIRKNYWYGRKNNLELVISRYPRGFNIEFFQNINYENPHGGRYDFDKFEKMPYLIKLMWINETKKMGEFLESLDLQILNKSKKEYKKSVDKIKRDFVESWHHPQESMDFKLSDLDGETIDSSYNNKDRDGNTIYNGEIKYFRHWDGRLWRGKVYHNINNMWWVIVNDREYRNISSFSLFNPTEEDFKLRRKAKDRKPQSYIDRKEKLKEASNKELLSELKDRGLRIKVS